jgi:peptidoglycan/LPS O-acetylase OafA/YrhL
MGTLRTVLAISVFFTHAWPGASVLVGGRYAVQLFYVISGFLISYVLVEKKAYPHVKSFYLNRYLRLYPIYLVVAIISSIALIASHHASFIDVYRNSPPSAVTLLTLSNMFVFGQDWIMFLGVHSHHLALVSDFKNSDVLLFEGLVIHQTWTLGVELSFYLIAPFVLPRRNLIYALLVFSVGLRVYLLRTGLGFRDPWTYRFFPTELALFLSGSLSHQLLLPLYRRIAAPLQSRLAATATLSIILIVFSFYLVPLSETLKAIVLFATFILLVPLTFLFQNSHRTDAWIGNLSYPIYVCHILIFRFLSVGAAHLGHVEPRVLAIVGAVFVVGFAVILDRSIAQPFESIRRRFRRRNIGLTPLDEANAFASS